MSRLGNRAFTLETVTGGAGFRERSVASLMTSDVFVGWLPGSDIRCEDAPAAPAGAAGTDEPASAGPETPLSEPVPAGRPCRQPRFPPPDKAALMRASRPPATVPPGRLSRRPPPG